MAEMDPAVFPRPCFDGKGHAVQLAPAPKSGGEHVLFCARCGDAVKLSVAIARTPTPTVGTPVLSFGIQTREGSSTGTMSD